MVRWHRYAALALLATIVAGHVALWLSPRMDAADKLRLTLMNAGIWAVVLLPAVGVEMWARTHGRRKSDDTDP